MHYRKEGLLTPGVRIGVVQACCVIFRFEILERVDLQPYWGDPIQIPTSLLRSWGRYTLGLHRTGVGRKTTEGEPAHSLNTWATSREQIANFM